MVCDDQFITIPFVATWEVLPNWSTLFKDHTINILDGELELALRMWMDPSWPVSTTQSVSRSEGDITTSEGVKNIRGSPHCNPASRPINAQVWWFASTEPAQVHPNNGRPQHWTDMILVPPLYPLQHKIWIMHHGHPPQITFKMSKQSGKGGMLMVTPTTPRQGENSIKPTIYMQQ